MSTDIASYGDAPTPWSCFIFDCALLFWGAVAGIFFREVQSRNGWSVPKEGEGGVLFVCAPHSNQFLDGVNVMKSVWQASSRRVSSLVAAKSIRRPILGEMFKAVQSIPVERPQDLAKSGAGTVTVDSNDSSIIIGTGTKFTESCKEPKTQIMLGKAVGFEQAMVAEVIADDKLKLKEPLPAGVVDKLLKKPSTYKTLPHVKQDVMFGAVQARLAEAEGSVAVFPEGGSHDRSDLLPLKAGAAMMALGACAASSKHPDRRPVRIVPVGLAYFAAHKFRSRAVIEFGAPIDVPKELVEGFEKGGEERRKAVAGAMSLIEQGIKSVTVRAPDLETLALIQAARRLYRPSGQHLNLAQTVELNKRFSAGYEAYKDEPRVVHLKEGVQEYNTLLNQVGLKDHQVEQAASPVLYSLALLLWRSWLLLLWGTFALPGVVLNAPIFIAGKRISKQKAKEALDASVVKIKGNDVLGTWKVLVAVLLTPALYSVYSIGAVILARWYGLSFTAQLLAPFATFGGMSLIGFWALKFGEAGMDLYKSLPPLVLSVLPGKEKQIDKLRAMRTRLQDEIHALVDELAPALFDDFEHTRFFKSRPSSPTEFDEDQLDAAATSATSIGGSGKVRRRG